MYTFKSPQGAHLVPCAKGFGNPGVPRLSFGGIRPELALMAGENVNIVIIICLKGRVTVNIL